MYDSHVIARGKAQLDTDAGDGHSAKVLVLTKEAGAPGSVIVLTVIDLGTQVAPPTPFVKNLVPGASFEIWGFGNGSTDDSTLSWAILA